MRHTTRFAVAAVFFAVAPAFLTTAASAQALRQKPTRASVSRSAVNEKAVVFVGGYFCDPSLLPSLWWSPASYPFQYEPQLEHRAVVRLTATPANVEIYVDGFYAGVAEDFHAFLDGLPVSSGAHEITLHLDGYRTIRQWIYFSPNSEFKVTQTLQRLDAGEMSEPPELAPQLPAPPKGTYVLPRTPAGAIGVAHVDELSTATEPGATAKPKDR